MERQPILAGVVTALVGFASSSAVVLTGLRAVGASPRQAASGLVALCMVMGLGMLWLAPRHRMPITLAWSTPGAALLAGTGTVSGGWPAAVGAFVLVGALIVLTGLWPRLGALIAAIPTTIAQAMLAGVLLELCLAPVHGVVDHPALVLPSVLVWLVLLRLAPRWAVPAAFATALSAIGTYLASGPGLHGALAPSPQLVFPHLSGGALLGLALPLYVVTMASQNVPGVAVMSSYGYQVPWRESMTVTGIGTLLAALAGGHTLNLAAITAALSASPEAHPDARRRWIAAWTGGWVYLVLALLSTAITSVVASAPDGVMTGVAGLALLGTLGSSLAGAVAASDGREAVVVTFVVAASGITVFGVSAAFWALAAGIAVYAVVRVGRIRVTRSTDSVDPVPR